MPAGSLAWRPGGAGGPGGDVEVGLGDIDADEDRCRYSWVSVLGAIPACPVLVMRPGGQVTVRDAVGRGSGWRPALFYGLGGPDGATAYHPYPHVMAAGQAAIGNIQGAPLRTVPMRTGPREPRGPPPARSSPASARSRLRRRWWGSRCPCAPGGYHADAVLGLDGGLSPRLQRKACRLAADLSFDRTARAPPGVARRRARRARPCGSIASGRRPASPAGRARRRPPPRASARPRGAGSSPSTPARSTPARRAGAT